MSTATNVKTIPAKVVSMDTNTYMIPATKEKYEKAHAAGKRVIVDATLRDSSDLDRWVNESFASTFPPVGFEATHKFSYWIAVSKRKYDYAVKHLHRYGAAAIYSADDFKRILGSK